MGLAPLTIHRLPSVGLFRFAVACRLDFNHPPTAVGGIVQELLQLILKDHQSRDHERIRTQSRQRRLNLLISLNRRCRD